MKILIFAPYFVPHIDGIAFVVEEFSKRLSNKGVFVTVFAPNLPYVEKEDEFLGKRIRILRFPAFYLIPNYPVPKIWKRVFWKIIFVIFREDYNLVVSYMRFFIVTFIALLYATVKRKKRIHIEHGSSFVTLSSKPKMAIARLIDLTLGALIFKCSDINISASSVVKNFIYHFDKRESPVILNSLNIDVVDEAETNHELKEKFGNKIIITHVGRLFRWKGAENSIRLIKSLPAGMKEKIIFLIIGNGEDFSMLKKMSEGEKAIMMLGELPRKEMHSILKISDIYLHASMPGGGLATSLLEAMYTECAVVATPNEGATDIIENNNNGIIVNSIEESKKALMKLIEDENLRKEYGQRAKKIVREKFCWDRSFDEYWKIIQQMEASSG
jgi:glycosyltransferase involved in cell wall biosynthesis